MNTYLKIKTVIDKESKRLQTEVDRYAELIAYAIGNVQGLETAMRIKFLPQSSLDTISRECDKELAMIKSLKESLNRYTQEQYNWTLSCKSMESHFISLCEHQWVNDGYNHHNGNDEFKCSICGDRR